MRPRTRYFQISNQWYIGSPILPFLLSLSLSFFSLQAQPTRTKLTLQNSKENWITYNFGNTSPTQFSQIKNLPEPKIQNLRLQFPNGAPNYYEGPDGGEVYQWAKNQYQWKRIDGSVFTEWPNGTWKLELKSKDHFTSFPPSCNDCLPNQVWNYVNGTKLFKNWVPHRKEYDYIFQNMSPTQRQNFLLVNDTVYKKPLKSILNFDFYGSKDWEIYIRGLESETNLPAFFSFMKLEFGMENHGRIPVILFDESSQMTKYQGREIPGGSEEGGFGGRDGITLCCGEKIPEVTGDFNLDEDAIRRIHYGTIYHEVAHNLDQMTCLAYKTASGSASTIEKPEAWFTEGFANFAEGQFSKRKKYYVYAELEKRIAENKIPKTYRGVVDASYRDLIPYSLGTILVEFIYSKYGKDGLIQYQKETCLGKSSENAILDVLNTKPDEFLKSALTWFERVKVDVLKQGKKYQFEGYTVILPQYAENYDNFVKKGFKLPNTAKEVTSYGDLPNLYETFPAYVESFSQRREGDFLGAHDTFFYLWKAGNYRWYLEDWEANVFPGNQIIYRKDGSTVIEWEDGKRKFVAKDGTSVMFWSPINKGYFDAKGNPLP